MQDNRTRHKVVASLVGIATAAAAMGQSVAPPRFEELRLRSFPAGDDTIGQLQLADVDADGHLDAVVRSASRLAAFRNDGRGNFADASSWLATVAPQPRSFVLVDVDGDSDLDLVVGSQQQVVVHPNLGGGAFGSPVVVALANLLAVGEIVPGDVDGDGDQDLLVLDAYAVRLLQNQGGQFVDATAALLVPPVGSHATAGFGDIDADGDLDFVLGGGDGTTPDRLYLNNGAGVFSDATAARLPWLSFHAAGRSLLDVDGDGDLDLVCANEGWCSSGACYPEQDLVLFNDGSGTFSIGVGFPTGPTRTAAVVPCDVDGDGDVDLVSGMYRHDENLRLWRNDGGGGFAAASAGEIPTVRDDVLALAIGDVDGDAVEDIVYAAYPTRGSAIRLHVGLGGGRFLDAAATGMPVVAARVQVLGDVDGDGDLDLVVASNGASPQLLRNTRGSFEVAAPGVLPSVAGTVVGMILRDVDADGDLDLVVAVNGQSSRLLRNSGASFSDVTASQMPPWSGPVTSIAAGDVDGDGHVDLVLGVSQQRNRLFRNSGSGMFTDQTLARLPSDSDRTNAVLLADVDGDGDLDLVYGNGDPAFGSQAGVQQDRLLQNNGAGVFADVTPTHMPIAPEFTDCLVAGDVDGDGDLDLLTSGGMTSLYENVGGGHFVDATAQRVPATSFGGFDLALGDVDVDGDLDLVVGLGGACFFRCQGRGNRLYLNTGNGAFVDAVPPLSPSVHPLDWTHAVCLADVDDDGDLDVVLGNDGESRILRNMQRQLHAPRLLRTGSAWTVELHVRHGLPSLYDIAVVHLSTLPTRIAIPPFGVLAIEPMLALPPIVVASPQTVGAASWAVSGGTSLAGIQIYAQAFHLAYPLAAGLTNAVDDVIR